MTDLKLTHLIASRICHDIISPVGAINNGIEIIRDESDRELRESAIDLIAASAHRASSLLQLFRIAFGAAGSMPDAMQLNEVRSLVEDCIESDQLRVDWRAPDDSLDKNLVRLLVNLIYIGIEAVPRGGVLYVGVRKEGATNLMIRVEGSVLVFDEDAMSILNDAASEAITTPREANLLLTKNITQILGGDLNCRKSEGKLELSVTL